VAAELQSSEPNSTTKQTLNTIVPLAKSITL
jgi:hypothetical protein